MRAIGVAAARWRKVLFPLMASTRVSITVCASAITASSPIVEADLITVIRVGRVKT